MNIYEITGNYLRLQEMLEDGEIDIETFNDTLESLDFELEEKADNYAKIIKNIQSAINGYKAEEERLRERRKTLENKIVSLKRNLENSMIALNKKKFKTDYFSFSIQKNAPILYIKNDKDIPTEYLTTPEPIIMKRKLLKAIKDGLTVDGVTIKQTEGVRIR